MARIAAESSVKKYEFIDALRGVAFLMVLAFHASHHVPDLAGPARTLADQGFEGVQLFFTISALTMFLSLDSRRESERCPTRNFFLRRFFRIAPLFYAAALVLACFRYRWTGGAWSNIAGIAATLAFVHAWSVPWINTYVPGGWSIGVEMNFYLLVPWLRRRIRTFQQAAWAAVLAMAGGLAATKAAGIVLPALVGRELFESHSEFLYYWLPIQMPIFCGGFCLYFLVVPILRGQVPPNRGLGLLQQCLCAYLFVSLAFSETRFYLGHALYGLLFVLLTWSLANNPTRLIVNPITRRLGVLSFSGYLTHFGALAIVAGALDRLGPGYAALAAPVRFLVLAALGTALTALFSTLTYHAIEVPGQALGRRLIRRLERTPGGAPAGADPVDLPGGGPVPAASAR